MISLGLRNKEIAVHLGVSEAAIKKRLCRLMRRVGASNRAALVRAAFVAGALAEDRRDRDRAVAPPDAREAAE